MRTALNARGCGSFLSQLLRPLSRSALFSNDLQRLATHHLAFVTLARLWTGVHNIINRLSIPLFLGDRRSHLISVSIPGAAGIFRREIPSQARTPWHTLGLCSALAVSMLLSVVSPREARNLSSSVHRATMIHPGASIIPQATCAVYSIVRAFEQSERFQSSNFSNQRVRGH
jgi:hypothetical protein